MRLFTLEEAKKHVVELQIFLESAKTHDGEPYPLYCGVDYEESDHKENGYEIKIDIENGDWKHEHIRCDLLVHDYFKSQGFDVEIDRMVYDDSDGDCYSAIHSVVKA